MFGCCIPAKKRKRKAVSKKVARAVFYRCNGMCFYCGKRIAKPVPRIGIYEIDHLEAFSAHGQDNIDNYYVACFQCNRKKHDMPLNIFLKKNGLTKRCQYLQILDQQQKINKNNNNKKQQILNGVYCMQVCKNLNSKFCSKHSGCNFR
jgi:CRISPR/Cas system Type II protein with McrA/HNH and RuvC-like nuclease domain